MEPNFDCDDSDTSIPDSERRLLDKMIEQVRTTWIEEWRRNFVKTYGKTCSYKPGPRLDGGQDIHGHQFKPIWPKFAKFIFDHSFNPIAYIRAQFESCRGDPPANPTIIMGPRAIRRYQLYQSNREVERDLTIAKDAQTRHARDAIELNKLLYGPGRTAYRVTILDDSLPLSALFRYSLAYSCGEQDLADIWFDPALLQYSYEYEAYNNTWGDLVPQPIKDVTRKMYGLSDKGG